MILERYLVRNLAAAVSLSLVGLVVVLVAVHLAEQAGQLSRFADPLTALELSALFAVEQGYQMLPLAGFFATLIVGARLGKHGELLAMLGSGARPMRLWLATVALVTAVAGVGVLWGEIAAPRAAAGILELYQNELGKGPGRLNAFFARRHRWFRYGDLVLFLPTVDARAEGLFRDPVIYRFADGLIADVIQARELRHDGDGWALIDARQHRASAGPSPHLARLPVDLEVSPRDLLDVSGNPRQLGSVAIARLIDRRERAGLDTVAHRVELHNRFAHPLLGVALFLVAGPWVLSPLRRRSLAVALGAGVVGVAVALAVAQVFRLLALGGQLPAPFGAWGIHALCLAAIPLAQALHRRFAD